PKPKLELDKTEQEWPFARLPRKDQERIVAKLTVTGLVGNGLAPAGRLADVALLSHQFPPPDPWPWTGKPRNVQTAVIGQLALATSGAGAIGGAAGIASATYLAHRFPPVPRLVTQPERSDIVLGEDPNYFLQVRLTNRGAAVRQVVLRRFQGA